MDLKELTERAELEIRQRNLHGWSFGLNDAKRRIGVCKYRQKRIEIARFHATHSTDAEVIDTLMHEVAHALAGPNTGHGALWKAIAKSLGANPKSCTSSAGVVTPPGDWRANCGTCGKVYQRYRRPLRLDGFRCRCVAKSPLLFAYVGDPDRMPPERPAPVAPWRATCPACGAEHKKLRRPRAGVWHCKCPGKGKIDWKYQPSG